MMTAWQRYWFSPAPYFDLAVVRIVAVALQLFWIMVYQPPLVEIAKLAELPEIYYQPLPLLNLLNLPFGWGFRPDLEALTLIYYLAVVAGSLSLIGLLTNPSLVVFAFCCVYLQAYEFSFGDFHHPEAVMMISLSVLALSPCGRVLSVDWLLKRHGSESFSESVLELRSELAGWPLRLIQWFFALMYLSAISMKLQGSGLDWINGFTLQYSLISDGLRHDSPLALWLAQHHTLVYLLQLFVFVFQPTFWLAVVFPKLRWIYVPLGLCLHIGIYLTMKAPFFQWIALYAVFIPWSEAVRLLQQRVGSAASSRRSIEMAQ